MAQIALEQGYDLKLTGAPTPTVVDAEFPRRVGLRPPEFRGVKWRPLVDEGADVRTGTPLLEHRGRPEIVLVSPATGKVAELKRGERRVLLEVAIDVSGGDEFEDSGSIDPASVDGEAVRSLLLRGGVWPLLRQHPFAKIADPAEKPKAIFVSGVASEPFQPDPAWILQGEEAAFQLGLDALGKLTDGKVHLTTRADSSHACRALSDARNVERHAIEGAHPSGHAAVQAFRIDRVKPGEVIWYLNAADALTIGRLCRDGHFPPERTVALAGAGIGAEHRQLYRTRAGVTLETLVEGKLEPGDQRLISGGVLTGAAVSASSPLGFFDHLVTAIPEGRRRDFLGWLRPGADKYSWSRTFLSALAPKEKTFVQDTNLNGGERACIQSGYCLKVCPTDVQPLFVWKAVSYGDIEEAEELGILDCVDCGLCTYVCPSKIEIGSIIRRGLDQMEKEG